MTPITHAVKRQLTLALLKPDICASQKLQVRVHEAIEAQNIKIVSQRPVLWTKEEAGAFYAEHKGKFFYDRLCGYMTSGPFQALVLSSPDAIKEWRALIGPTHPCRARIHQPTTLRALYGLSDTRNSFHGSDSDETAKNEIAFFFPELSIDNLLKVQDSQA
ncbi:nucleoside diphosphate kinase [Phycomyces blakesleeanus]|uniref:Nucleoside diphosphate kinase n=1 Tax=Phycomyces blakesleeanus TaxID=4837 RepID=A0ABR3B806_PHYBL